VESAKGVRNYLQSVDYPASPPDLIVAAQDSGAPTSLMMLLGLLPTAVEFHNPEEIVDQLERMKA
jgi:Protein of unknown function (DUF2795)